MEKSEITSKTSSLKSVSNLLPETSVIRRDRSNVFVQKKVFTKIKNI